MVRAKKKTVAVLAIFSGILMMLAFLRCFFGVETTDEAMYIAESSAVADGAIPYVTNWFHSSGYAVVAAPFVKLYEVVTGGNTGIFLFTRIMYTIVKIVLLIWGVLAIKKIYSLRTAILFLAPLILFAPYSLSNFSYNTISFFLDVLAACYMMRLLKRGTQGDAVVVAVLVACAAFLNPTNAIMALWWLVVLIYFSAVKAISADCIWRYIAAGLGTAILVCLVLSCLAGGVSVFIEGFASAMKYNPYLYHKEVTGAAQWAYIKPMMLGALFCVGFCVFCQFVFSRIIFWKKAGGRSSSSIQIGTAVFVFVSCVYYCKSAVYIMRVLTGGLLFIPPLLCMMRKKWDKELFFVWWFPSVLNLAVSALTSYYGISDRAYLLLPAVLMLTLLLEEEYDDEKEKAFINLFPAVLSFALFCSLFGYTYRDVNVWMTNARVESGIYKGLFTTKENKEYLTELESYVKEITNEEDYVFAQQSFPALYLMTEGRMLAPTSWAAFVFSDIPYTGNDYVRRYFDFVQREPDVILYHYNNLGPFVDIQENKYPFCKFIIDNYVEEEGSEKLPKLKIYRRK